MWRWMLDTRNVQGMSVPPMFQFWAVTTSPTLIPSTSWNSTGSGAASNLAPCTRMWRYPYSAKIQFAWFCISVVDWR